MRIARPASVKLVESLLVLCVSPVVKRSGYNHLVLDTDKSFQVKGRWDACSESLGHLLAGVACVLV